jgi:hypothetical protein
MRKYMLNTKWFWLLAFMPLVLFMAGCSDCTSCTVPKPTVTVSVPLCGAVGVALNTPITATFSEAMEPASINATSFTVTGPGTTAVAGSVAYAGGVATFTPTSALAFNTTYTVNISTAARSALGVNSAGSTCTFKTLADPIPPTAVLTNPACGAIGVPIGTTPIVVTFSKPMNPATITATSFTVTGTVAGVPTAIPVGAPVYSAVTNTAAITPTGALPYNAVITVTITTAATSLTGTAMAATYSCSFNTAIQPSVSFTSPGCAAPAVLTNQPVVITFTKAMLQSTIFNGIGGTFRLTHLVAGIPTDIPGLITYNALTNAATYTPTALLPAGTAITVTVTAGITDLGGNPLANPFSCSFTTAPGAPVAIGPAASGCTILAGSTVTNVAGTATTVTGDVCVSPGSAITGFGPPASITGSFHSADAVAATAQGELTTAYNQAAGAPGGAVLSADIGGQTLPPGVYKTTSGQPSLGITGNLTLAGGADPNAFWIFQIVSTLTTAAGNSQVILTGTALPKNVFWQVGSSATLGTNTIFQGTIMAQASVTITTGAVLNGRALARVGAVTLDTNTVTNPGP